MNKVQKENNNLIETKRFFLLMSKKKSVLMPVRNSNVVCMFIKGNCPDHKSLLFQLLCTLLILQKHFYTCSNRQIVTILPAPTNTSRDVTQQY